MLNTEGVSQERVFLIVFPFDMFLYLFATFNITLFEIQKGYYVFGFKWILCTYNNGRSVLYILVYANENSP